jgi:diketogulonate reductase-like aldo/keto reductase
MITLWVFYSSFSSNDTNQPLNWKNNQVTLNNNVLMPTIGFGTAGLQNKEERIRYAISVGYRLLDTASDTGPWYKTESIIGSSVLPRVQRSHLFIVTKLHPQDHGKLNAARAIQLSLANLNSYIDLYLIHYPECFEEICLNLPEGTWEDSWRVMEEYYQLGLIKALGVSNFNMEQMVRLWEMATIKPAVWQNWYDPLHQSDEIVEFCRGHGIQFMAYSSLGTQWRNDQLIHDNIALNKIARDHSKSVSQIILRWLLHHQIVVIPRSNNDEHIKENLDLDFTLTPDEISVMDALN